MLVLFDLPNGGSSERRSYAQFRKFLLNDGYVMEHYSVYSRVTLSRDSAEAHLGRLRANLPTAGAVTVLILTERQYEARQVLVNTMREAKRADVVPQLTLVF